MTAKKTAVAESEKPIQVVAIDGPQVLDIVNAGIAHVVEATGLDVQKSRYKAMRAVAYQAFCEAIEADTFEDLVDRALANVGALPSGWKIEVPTNTSLTQPSSKAARDKTVAR